MATRQDLGKLQGTGQTSQSFARRVDTYSRPAPIPQNTSLDQLTDALGVAGRATAQMLGRKKAEERAEKEKLDVEKAQAYARRFSAENDGGLLTSIQLGEAFADMSEHLVAQIVEDENRLAFYGSTKEQLLGLSDEQLMDKQGMLDLYASIEQDVLKQTEGFDFAQSGALAGVQNAIREMSIAHSQYRDGKVRERAKGTLEGQVFEIMGQGGSIETINEALSALDKKPSPFDNVGRKQIIVDALIDYDLSTEGDLVAERVIKANKWLQGSETSQKLFEASGKIASTRISRLRDEQFEKGVQEQAQFDDAYARLSELVVNGDREGINEVIKNSSGITGEGAGLANRINQAAEAALARIKVDPVASTGAAVLARSDIQSRASQGKAGTLEEEVALLQNRTDISQTQLSQLIGDLPVLMEGFSQLNEQTHTAAFDRRFGGQLKAYSSVPEMLPIQFSLGEQGESLDSIAADIWDQETTRLIGDYIEENGEAPRRLDASGGIYDMAEEKVKQRLQEVIALGGNLAAAPTENPTNEPKVGDEVTAADGTRARYLGGDIKDDNNFEVIADEPAPQPEPQPEPEPQADLFGDALKTATELFNELSDTPD